MTPGLPEYQGQAPVKVEKASRIAPKEMHQRMCSGGQGLLTLRDLGIDFDLGAAAVASGIDTSHRVEDAHGALSGVQGKETQESAGVVKLDSIFIGNEFDPFELPDEEEEEEEEDEDDAEGGGGHGAEQQLPQVEIHAQSHQGIHHKPHAAAGADAGAKTHTSMLADLDELLIDEKKSKWERDIISARRGDMHREAWAVTERLSDSIISQFSTHVPKMAHSFPFELDVWQKEAVYHLEKGNSIFVSAHTSAGKTVTAEYAIGMAFQHRTKCIYTSPIKTLSNQKFRDFKNIFSDVGIITGDVSINPTATCLIMTTEVLRSMLFKGADLIRDVEWVVFDEVHYVNDAERGHVWEEVIIMLPPHVGLIMLSATVPNSFEFADWIGRTKKKKVYLLGTTKRPIPLEHHIFYKDKTYKVVDAAGKFLSKEYSEATGEQSKAKEKAAKKGGTTAHMQGRRELSQWSQLVDYLKKNSLLPTIVFSFSKRRCEEAATTLQSTDLSTAVEQSEVVRFMNESFSRLTPGDQKLPQLIRLKDMLKRGIGVHHAGLLPLAKEVVEMLFGRGLVKVLFATETFAMVGRLLFFMWLAMRSLLVGVYIPYRNRSRVNASHVNEQGFSLDNFGRP
jgi:antiviral helicase SKI2